MPKSQELMTIGDVAQKAGLKTSALRYYESVGLLPAPERVSGQRRYDTTILKQIAFIQAAQGTGFSIREMRTLIGASDTMTPYPERLRLLAEQKLPDVEALIAHAQAMRRVLEAALICRCATPDDCHLFMTSRPAESSPEHDR